MGLEQKVSQTFEISPIQQDVVYKWSNTLQWYIATSFSNFIIVDTVATYQGPLQSPLLLRAFSSSASLSLKSYMSKKMYIWLLKEYLVRTCKDETRKKQYECHMLTSIEFINYFGYAKWRLEDFGNFRFIMRRVLSRDKARRSSEQSFQYSFESFDIGIGNFWNEIFWYQYCFGYYFIIIII